MTGHSDRAQTGSIRLLLGSMLLCTSLLADADTARDRTVTAHWGWQMTAKSTELAKGQVVLTGELNGVNFNNTGKGPLQHLALNCPFINHVDSGRLSGSGYCVGTDPDNDRVYQRWTCAGSFPICEGEYSWINGTGKYAGITGRGTFKASFIGSANFGWTDWTGEYQIP